MMQPEIPVDRSTLVALAGLAAFFVCIVFAWIIAFRHFQYGDQTGETMVSMTTPETETDEPQNVRIVEVPIAGAVDGGPAVGGRMMRIADRDTAQLRTVRKMIAPAAPPAPPAPPESISVGAGAPGNPDSIPDETPPADVTQQQTQALPVVRTKPKYPVIYTYSGEPWTWACASPPETLPRDYWN